MKINKIMITNILGIKHLNVSPGKINIIDGANASGKTSFLEAIKIAVGGGHDATLLRNGEEKGEIVLQFDNGMKLTKSVGIEKSKITLKDEHGGVVPRAATFLKSIIDTVGLNPIQFLTASPKEQVDMLLNSVDFEYDLDKFIEIVGPGGTSSPTIENIVETADRIRKGFYDQRTVINAAVKEKNVMVEQVRDSMPECGETDFADEYKSLEQALADHKADLDNGLKVIYEDRGAVKEVLRGAKEKLKDGVRERHIEAIEQMNKIRDAEQDAINLEYDTKIEHADEDAERADRAIRIKLDPEIEEIARKVGVAGENLAKADQYASNIKYIDEGDRYISLKAGESETLTDKIKQLDEFKVDLLKNIPIEGLNIVDGQMLLDGVLFETVNHAKQIQFCLNVANLRGLELPLVCVDGLEAMDQHSFDLFVKEAEKTDMQFFVTRVTEDETLCVR